MDINQFIIDLQEKLKQFEFAGTQFDRLTIHCRLIGFEIDVKPPA